MVLQLPIGDKVDEGDALRIGAINCVQRDRLGRDHRPTPTGETDSCGAK